MSYGKLSSLGRLEADAVIIKDDLLEYVSQIGYKGK